MSLAPDTSSVGCDSVTLLGLLQVIREVMDLHPELQLAARAVDPTDTEALAASISACVKQRITDKPSTGLRAMGGDSKARHIARLCQAHIQLLRQDEPLPQAEDPAGCVRGLIVSTWRGGPLCSSIHAAQRRLLHREEPA